MSRENLFSYWRGIHSKAHWICEPFKPFPTLSLNPQNYNHLHEFTGFSEIIKVRWSQAESGQKKSSRAQFGNSKPGCPKVLARKSGDLTFQTLASQYFLAELFS
jgi:hypothetical protein